MTQAGIADMRGAEVVEVSASVGGMTCASCAARVEKVLARQPGVQHAAVNFGTARATVAYDPTRADLDTITRSVEGIGYEFTAASVAASAQSDEDINEREWLRRIVVSWPLGIAVLLLLTLDMDSEWARWSAAL